MDGNCENAMGDLGGGMLHLGESVRAAPAAG